LRSSRAPDGIRGIGRATAVALASEGADVVVTGTGRDPASYPDDEKQAGWKDVEGTAQMELARHGITVNAVCPGTIDTARMDILGRGAGWQGVLERIPMGRAASDEEVAGLIQLLCSSAAAFMTGQSISIDGGVVMS
jgi:NAD(P)-dependent dehydrogenase (short-subunit alcohol dehydrogenase family)